jgi:protein-disulfide isomerase
MRVLLHCVGLLVTLSASVSPAATDDSGITHQQADDILNELRQIRQLLKEPARPASGSEPPVADRVVKVSLKLEGSVLIGSKDAPLTMVEFTDYQCPFCERFHSTTFKEIKKNYIDTGRLRFYSRDLPLPMHNNAMRAAQAARCGGEQGQFWEMRDRLQSNPDKLDLDNLLTYARDLKLDVGKFQTCVETEKYKGAVESDLSEARNLGANGTPAFVVGKSTPDGVDGQMVLGALPYETFDQILKERTTPK